MDSCKLPLLPAKINMYSCGVTVYDKCHMGHGRSLYTFDTLVKYLRYRGYERRGNDGRMDLAALRRRRFLDKFQQPAGHDQNAA